MSDRKISISVVIPTFNREKTIYKCLESVVKQTYVVDEIIVVDDGSTDRTKNIITDFPSDKIRLICQRHKGAQAARNVGIVNAIGEYIAFLDSDDEWVLDKLEKQLKIIKVKPNAIVYSNCYVIKKSIKVIWKISGKSGYVYKELLMHPGPMFQGMIVLKSALLDIGLLDEKVPAYQEWDTSIRLAKDHELIHMEEPLFYYNIHDDETISKSSKKDILGYEYVVKKNKKNIVRLWGYRGLIEHYKLLLKKSMQYKSRKVYKYIVKWYLVELLHKMKEELIWGKK